MFITSGNKVLNHYPLWKYILLVAVVLLAFVYALPNLYGEDPAVQGTNFQFRFQNAEQQLKAQDLIKNALNDNFTVALSLAPATPRWLQRFNAEPMKLGLDLRGGVHFLLDVDINSVLKQRLHGAMKNMGDELRNARIRYSGLAMSADNIITLRFRDADSLKSARDLLQRTFPEYTLQPNQGDKLQLQLSMAPEAIIKAQDYVIEQTMTTLSNRVDELGVSNAMVQRQGATRVSVDLPGVLDAGRAKQIVGGTATLEFHMVDDAHDASGFVGQQAPLGTRMYSLHGMPMLLKNEIVLHGASITSAVASFGEDGRPSVDIRLGGGGEALFNRVTRDNVGKPMAIVYVEMKADHAMMDGKSVKTYRKVERIISAPIINSALGSNFQITGISDPREAANLALLLRAGALPANIDFVQERTVGPTLGKENIQKGLMSVAVGFILVVFFMAMYYRLFGLFANVALFMNLILLTALLSLLGMVLTLPGIAGVVLTVAMAVDANVLIFERIREELRNGMSPQASIHAGYERAFSTIVDANVTTLIAAMALFAIGTGPIKGFAITLTLGLMTSMVTAIAGTRAMVNLAYGRQRNLKSLSIGRTH